MKIGFCITSMNNGGAERVMSILVNHFAANGNEVHLFVYNHEPSFYKLNSSVNVYYLQNSKNYLGKLGTIINHVRHFNKISKLIKKTNIKCLVGFTTVVNCISIMLGKVNGLPIIISERNDPQFYNPGVIVNLLRKVCYRFADSIVLQTERSIKSFELIKVKLPADKIVIFNPIDPSFKDENVPRKKIIISVGRQSFEKGHDQLLAAFSLAKTKDWELHLIGDGVERNNLIALSRELNIYDKIVWLGKQNRISELLNESSIFILPSRTEGFPNALCEAMICGCAVISFDCPNGPSEIIKNNENGILIDNGDIKQLAETITKLISEPILRKTLGREASLLKCELNKDVIGLQWELHLEKVFNRKIK